MPIIYAENITSYRPHDHKPELPKGVSRLDISCIEHVAGEPAYVGRVLATEIRYSVRIMSDVWADIHYAVVLNDDGTTSKVTTYNSEFSARPHTVIVDAPQSDIDAYEEGIRVAEEKSARKKRERQIAIAQHDAKKRILTQWGKGDTVRVFKGRKVPKGTVGLCIWTGDGDYGRRCGIKDAKGTVHWTACTNVELANANELAILANGDWLALESQLRNAKVLADRKARDAAPSKGKKVKTNCGRTGKVFWVADDGSRLGVRWGKNREDVVWCNANTVSAV